MSDHETGQDAGNTTGQILEQRIDQCLYHLRFFHTRALAQSLIEKGRVRINGGRVYKSSRKVKIGDILVFAQGDQIRSIKILGLLDARASAPIAQSQYVEALAQAQNSEN